MNRFLLCSALLLLVSAPLVAEPEIPASAWEQHPEGIALAILTKTGASNGAPTCTISAFLKNTSRSVKSFAGFDGSHREFEIFYEDSRGSQIPLRDYTPPTITLAKMEVCPEIKPGETLSLVVNLTPVEIGLIKAHPAKCVFNMIDQGNGGIRGFWIQSTPRILIVRP